MMTSDPGAVHPGDEIRADHINFIRELAKSLGIEVSGSLSMLDSGTLSTNDMPALWVKLTAVTTGSYAWTEQISTGTGGWAAGPRAGTVTTDAAKEINGNALTIPGGGYIVRAWRSEGGSMLFQFGAC